MIKIPKWVNIKNYRIMTSTKKKKAVEGIKKKSIRMDERRS